VRDRLRLLPRAVVQPFIAIRTRGNEFGKLGAIERAMQTREFKFKFTVTVGVYDYDYDLFFIKGQIRKSTKKKPTINV
jgi:hypothetical protein